MTPSGNIYCDWWEEEDPGNGEGGISCGIDKASFVPAKDTSNCDLSWIGSMVWVGRTAGKGVCTGGLAGKAAPGVRLPILDYGRTVAHQDLACNAAADGLTCWNTRTHHGFKLSRAAQLTW